MRAKKRVCTIKFQEDEADLADNQNPELPQQVDLEQLKLHNYIQTFVTKKRFGVFKNKQLTLTYPQLHILLSDFKSTFHNEIQKEKIKAQELIVSFKQQKLQLDKQTQRLSTLDQLNNIKSLQMQEQVRQMHIQLCNLKIELQTAKRKQDIYLFHQKFLMEERDTILYLKEALCGVRNKLGMLSNITDELIKAARKITQQHLIRNIVTEQNQNNSRNMLISLQQKRLIFELTSVYSQAKQTIQSIQEYASRLDKIDLTVKTQTSWHVERKLADTEQALKKLQVQLIQKQNQIKLLKSVKVNM